MSARGSILAAAAAVGVAGAAPPMLPPPSEPTLPAPARAPTEEPGERAGEVLLEQLGLTRVRAARLRQELRRGGGTDRSAQIEELGRLYVTLLNEATDADDRRLWEERARELLELAPEAETFELRVNLAKATYLTAEEAVERHRLLLGRRADVTEAERVLRGVLPTFRGIGTGADQRVRALERREEGAGAGELRRLQQELGEARRLRSLAMYYAGWAGYYLAMLTQDGTLATQAAKDLGWLLNAAPGQVASVERVNDGLLEFEHVARAAVGTALCLSLAGDDVAALRWMDLVEQTPNLSAAVREQMLSRRMIVLARAGRWADLRAHVSRARRAEGINAEPKRLRVADARLLAVLTLGAAGAERERAAIAKEIDDLSRMAMEDMVSAGEAGHIIDLLSRFGSAPIGESGFIVRYVRGLQAYERAREAHRAAGEDPESPTADAGVANRYREAASAFEDAVGSEDAPKFTGSLGPAWTKYGLSLLYAGEPERAAEIFAAAMDRLSGEAKREVHWLAIVSLDRAVEGGKPSRQGDRDALASSYLDAYPDTPTASQLLLVQSRRGALDDGQALRRLLDVPSTSPLYLAARRQAASLLFDAYRRAGANARAAAARAFIDTAEGVLDADEAGARGEGAPADESARSFIARARQTLDAMLALEPPDDTGAGRLIERMTTLTLARGIDNPQLMQELLYRRLQIAVIRGDRELIERTGGELRRAGGPYADAAETLLYRSSLETRARNTEDRVAARGVVRAGLRLLEASGERLSPEGRRGIRENVASAASLLADEEPEMAKLAFEYDRALFDEAAAPPPVLRRLAASAELFGEKSLAVRVWDAFAGVFDPPAPEWFEARFNVIRLTASHDPKGARAALDEHAALYPEWGPEPWGKRFATLDLSLPSGAPAAAPR